MQPEVAISPEPRVERPPSRIHGGERSVKREGRLASGAGAPRVSLPLRSVHHRFVLMTTDAAVLLLSFLTGAVASSASADPIATLTQNWPWIAAACGLFLVMVGGMDGYDLPVASRIRSGVGAAWKGLLLTGGIIGAGRWGIGAVPALESGIGFLAVGLVGLAVSRAGYALLFSRPTFRRRVLVVGAGSSGRTIGEALQELAPFFDLVGYVDDGKSVGRDVLPGAPVLGGRDDMRQLVGEHRVSDVVVAITHQIAPELIREIVRCSERHVRIVPMPELYAELTGRVPVEHIGDRWFSYLPIDQHIGGFYALVKRGMDVVVSAVGLVVVGAIFPVVALAIKLDSPGPIFYRPERLSQGYRPFRVFKFRTMVTDADRIGDPTFTKASDPRITRVGNLLRLTHIDELPQFLNIFKGEMSLVGPRPERYVSAFEESIPYYSSRYIVRPGAAGWALVNQGYAEGVEDTLRKLEYDLHYVKHRALWLDIVIMVKTVLTMVSLRGR